jgi:acetyltransferase-like isoleucine patch superfamily enzyme
VQREFDNLGRFVTRTIPALRPIHETRDTQTPITARMWFLQKALGFNRDVYWPVHFTSIVSGSWRNVYCGIETCPGFSPGCYIQAIGKIYIGDYTQIAPNVGIISANHNLHDNRKHIVSEVRIGSYGWIGMNAVILPGVILGDFTIVGAGAVVTKSFEEGYCVLAGNPARMVRKLDPAQCVRHHSAFEYNGYVKHTDFEAFRQRYLLV